ncbi:MAG TPA: ankyrin repeat domain-containing protein [Terriglobia bacterium]|nr:ankyrin repeat domain-containing protein [Terriglobia bacterium]
MSRPLARAAAATLLFTLSALAATDLRLLEAVKRRDHQAVLALLAAKVNVNAAQPDGATALAWAAYLDEEDTAVKLLAAGAKPNTADEYGETPLTLACANGDAVLVDKLLAAGAEANAARWDGETALMIAAGVGNVKTVNLLIGHGASVNAAESRQGQTALMWATAEHHPEVVQTLIAHGAAVRAASKRGFTALVFAAAKNDSQSAQALLDAGADPNYTLPNGPTVLNVAASYRSTAVAILLTDRGADPNVPDRQGNTPLHLAARSGDLSLVEKLIAKGALVNARTPDTPAPKGGPGGADVFAMVRFVAGEQTPLMLAAKADHVDVMRALVAAGADAKLKAQDGTTILSAAAGSGHLDAVQYAYELNPDVKVTSAVTGATLMHAAVLGTAAVATQDQICEVIRFLAAHGAPLDETDSHGRTPLFYAKLPPIDKAVKLLHDLIIKSGAQPKVMPRR